MGWSGWSWDLCPSKVVAIFFLIEDCYIELHGMVHFYGTSI